MKVVRHSVSNLVFKDPPGCIWLFGLFFLLISGIFIAGLSGLFNNLNELSGLEHAGIWIISLAGFAAGIWIIYSHPGITADFNMAEETLIIIRRGIFRNESEKYNFKQIRKIELMESQDTEGDPIYYITLELNTNKKVKLNVLGQHGKEEFGKHIELMNNFIFK